jgi:hypothetical protein
MNDLFLVQPSCCENITEFKSLLEKFGFESGRYIVPFPINWEQRVRASFADLGDLDKARLTQLLRRATEKNRYHKMPVSYAEGKSWVENAAPKLTGTVFQAAVSGRPGPDPAIPKVETVDSLDLPPTAEERISSKAAEFRRVTKALLSAAPEVWVIDPYCNPITVDRQRALLPILENCKDKAMRIEIWLREENCSAKDSALTDKLKLLKKQAGLDEKCKLSLHLVDDKAPEDRMHARYIFSKFGGIRFDQGFQETNALQDVMPVMQALVDQLVARYSTGASNGIVNRLISV